MSEREGDGSANGEVAARPTEENSQSYHPGLLGVGITLPRNIDVSSLTDEELDKLFEELDARSREEITNLQREAEAQARQREEADLKRQETLSQAAPSPD